MALGDFFSDLVLDLQYGGAYEFLLPFLIIWVVLFAALEKTAVLGHQGPKGSEKPRTPLNLIASIVISLIVIINTGIIQLMNSFLTNMGMWMIIAFMFLLLSAFFTKGSFSGLPIFVGMGVALVAVYLSLSFDPGQNGYYIGRPFSSIFGQYISTDAINGLFLVAVIVGAIGFAIKSNNGEDDGKTIRIRS